MKTYLVGGAVRDELLGLPVTDRDYLVVGATEGEMLDLGFRRMDVAFPVFLHPDSGDEYALARRERKTGPGYKGFEVDAGPDVTLEEDLARRDLTINALARGEAGELVDVFGGRDDLDNGLLRHITPAFSEDPVRLLRAARFAAKLGRWGFRLAHGTHALLKQMAGFEELATVLPERLREEMTKALRTEQPWRFFEVLHRCGALARLLPELAAGMGGPVSHGSNPDARPILALKCVASQTQEPELRLAAMATAVLADPAGGRRFSKALRLDRASTELLERLLAWPVERVGNADAETLLALLEQTKGLQHPIRLQQLQVLWRCLDVDSTAAERSEQARRAAAAVNADDLLAQGWRGPELGAELRRRRLVSIEGVLTEEARGLD